MCTNFLLAVPDDTTTDLATMYLSARCLELAGTTATSLYVVPRSLRFPLVAPAFPPAPLQPPTTLARWTNQYGFVGVAASPPTFANFPCFMDGLNEAGLSAAGLWMPGTTYPESGPQEYVSFSDLVAWMLGNFATVDAIEEALPSISVVGPPSPSDPTQNPYNYAPLHFIATDKSGASIVIEFIDGVMKCYSRTNSGEATDDGVLTNAPSYDWQRANLANYAHLSVVSPATSLTSRTGAPVGSGLLGMPGDSMSASRFVKAVTLRTGFTRMQEDGSSWLPAPVGETPGFSGSEQTMVNVAMQMVQLIQATPYGTALEQGPNSTTAVVGDWTMWSLVRDHTHGKLYYSTAFNGIMRAIDLTPQLFDPGPLKTIPLLPSPASLPWYEDATATFAPLAEAAS